MEKILKVHSVNDYAWYIGAEELHPLISVIHYDELEHCRHSLNNYGVHRPILQPPAIYFYEGNGRPACPRVAKKQTLH